MKAFRDKRRKDIIICIFFIIAVILFLIGGKRLEAAEKISDSIKSEGNIEYDANGDGKAEVLFYSKDLSVLAEGIEKLNANTITLSEKYDELTEASIKHKIAIINGLNSNVYAKANIESSATYDDLITKINNIPAPTKAKGSYYSSGDNTGLNAGLSINKTGADIGIDGVNEIKLGANESITLPSGYYPNDITISNNVMNKGDLKMVPGGSGVFPVASGYYTGGQIDTTQVYKAGYTEGAAAAAANRPNVSITYRVRHTHGSWCYPEAKPLHSEWTGNKLQDDGHSWARKWESTTTCSVCGESWTARSGNGWPGHDGPDGKFYNHLVNGKCPKASLCCGKPEGEYTTTNAISIGTGDTLVSAEVRY